MERKTLTLNISEEHRSAILSGDASHVAAVVHEWPDQATGYVVGVGTEQECQESFPVGIIIRFDWDKSERKQYVWEIEEIKAMLENGDGR